MERKAKIFVAGSRGLVGSAIVRQLRLQGYDQILETTSSQLDLRRQAAVEDFFQQEKPDYVFMAAAKVGGILANNTYPASFIYENMMIETNVIQAAHLTGVKKLLFLGSSCIYPKLAPQPLKEESLLTGLLEPTNEPYAIAKIAGIKLCEAYWRQYQDKFISVMPTNLYGPNDNFDLQNSHVLPALIRKFHEAKLQNLPSVTVWGSGTPRREFLHVDDLADACVYLMNHYEQPEFVNIGVGKDLTIAELAQLVSEVVGFDGRIEYDASKPDGTPVKRLDISKLEGLGWQPQISLRDGLQSTYEWFLQSEQQLRGY